MHLGVIYLFHLYLRPYCILGMLDSYCSVSKSCLTLRPHELQHARLPCSSLSPRVCSNWCLLSWWCHPTISSSVAPFSCLQSFPASGSFPMSQLFTSGGQSIGASGLASAFPVNIQGWFPLGLTGLNSLQSKELSSLLQHHSSKASILQCWAFFMVQLSHLYMTTGKTIALTIQTFVSKVMSLLFNTLSRFSGLSAGNESTCNTGDSGSIPGSGRSAGEGDGYPLQYSGLENSMDCLCACSRKESDTTEQLSLSQVCHRFSSREQASFNFRGCSSL